MNRSDLVGDDPSRAHESPDAAASSNTAATRQAILEAARAAFAEQGYEAASLRDIAAAAAVTKPMIYYYFGSKDGLYAAVVAATTVGLRTTLGAAAKTGSTLRERLAAVTRVYTNPSADRAAALVFLARCGAPAAGRQDAGLATLLHDMHVEIIRTMVIEALAREEVRSDLDAAMFAEVFHGGLVMLFEPLPPRAARLLPRRATALIDLLMEGARPRA